jgi:hypothetical protein
MERVAIPGETAYAMITEYKNPVRDSSAIHIPRNTLNNSRSFNPIQPATSSVPRASTPAVLQIRQLAETSIHSFAVLPIGSGNTTSLRRAIAIISLFDIFLNSGPALM